MPSSPRSSGTRPATRPARPQPAVATGSGLVHERGAHRFARTVAMERICSLFLDGAVPFDAPLSERAIAEAIGLGRMPVREALRDLARERIVSVEPGRGTYLRRLSAQETTELLEVRMAIEGMAARLAAERRVTGELPKVVAALRTLGKGRLTGKRLRKAEEVGDRVHWLIVEGSRNEMLNTLYAGLRLRIAISLRLVQRREEPRIRETIAEHLAIAEAVLAGSPDEAVMALQTHLGHGHAVTMANLERMQLEPEAREPSPKPPLARRRGRRPA